MEYTNVLDYAARASVRTRGLLAGLPLPLCNQVLANAACRYAAAGERIFAAGDRANALWICASGTVRLSRTTSTGRRRTLAYMGEGAWFDVAGFFLGHQQCDAVAQTYVAFLVLQRADIERRLQTSPDFGQRLLQQLAQQVSELGTELADARALPLDALLAKALAGLVRQHGRPVRARSGAARVGVPLVQSELGELIGYSRQHVNAALKRLERRGLVSLSGRDIVIDDPTTLAAACEC